MTGSASGAERTPPPSSSGSSAGPSRPWRWRRATGSHELAELDQERAAELVRRSAEVFLDQEPVSARTAEVAVEDDLEEDDHEGTVGAPVPERVGLPHDLRQELELAAREMTDAAEAAHAAREAAERAAREQALRARTESQRREVAEQLAAESVDQVAAAAAERIRVEEEARRQAALAAEAAAARATAEQSALRATLEREAAEARARAHAETAALALEERAAAEARAQELAASLEEARAALLERTEATLASEAAPSPTPPPEPAARAAESRVEARIAPEGVPDRVELRSPGSSAPLTVLLGLGALVAAGVAVYEAYLDRLTTAPGVAASLTTLVLVVVVGRAQGAVARVWLEQGVLHVEEGDTHRRFDLTSPATKVEMVGRPGTRRWKVLFLRKGMAPYEIDAGLVDPVAFVEAIRPYRPRLTSPVE